MLKNIGISVFFLVLVVGLVVGLIWLARLLVVSLLQFARSNPLWFLFWVHFVLHPLIAVYLLLIFCFVKFICENIYEVFFQVDAPMLRSELRKCGIRLKKDDEIDKRSAPVRRGHYQVH